MNSRSVLTAVAAVVAVSGSVAAWRIETAPPPMRVHLLPDPARGSSVSTVGVTTGVAGVFQVTSVFAIEPLVVESVRALHVDPGVQVRTSRAFFIGLDGAYPGRVATNGGIGQICEPWPPAGFGPSYKVEGLELPAQSQVSVVMWATTSHMTGTHAFEGVEIVVRRPGTAVRTTLRDPSVRLELRAVTPDVFDDDKLTGHWCTLRPDSRWSNPWPGVPS